MLAGKEQADFNTQNGMLDLFSESLVFCNFVSNSCLPNSLVFQGTNENCPTWLPLVCNLVFFSQPCSNDIIQERVGVFESFHFGLSESKQQSKVVYMGLIHVQQILCYSKQVFLTCRRGWKKAVTQISKWVITTNVSITPIGHLPSVSTLQVGCVAGGREQTGPLWEAVTAPADGVQYTPSFILLKPSY